MERAGFRVLVVILGCLFSAAAVAQWPAPERYRAFDIYEGVPRLTPHRLAQLRKDNTFFITFSGGPGCGVANAFASQFFPHHRSKFPEVPMYLVDELSEHGVDGVTRSLVPGSPMVLVFRGAKIIDGQSGIGGRLSGGPFDPLLVRIGLPPSGASSGAERGQVFWRDDWRRKKISDLGLKVIYHTLAEVDAQFADFDGVSFETNIITHSNFYGAKIENARFDRVLWVDTVCPDGSNSDEHGYTCVGY